MIDFQKIKRRKFFKAGSQAFCGFVTFRNCPFNLILTQEKQIPKKGILIITKGEDPVKLVKSALSELGGLRNYILKGDKVVIKPNIGWDRTPDLAATTNPLMVGAMVRECLECGASSVRVMDNPCNDPRRCYKRSGIKEESEKAGAKVEYMDESKFIKVNFNGEFIKEWMVYKDIYEADKIINFPILKHHSLSKITMGMKNWYGAIGGTRNTLHQNIDIGIADMAKFFKPVLTFLDAYRILRRNGPQGGNTADVELKKTLIAGADPVSVEAMGAKIFGHEPGEIGYINKAFSMGLGEMDLSKIDIKQVEI